MTEPRRLSSQPLARVREKARYTKEESYKPRIFIPPLVSMSDFLQQTGGHTMFTYEKSIFINRPQQEVFDFLYNPANDPQWRSSVESAEWSVRR